MAKFLCENLLYKGVEFYFGDGPGERLRGKVVGSSEVVSNAGV